MNLKLSQFNGRFSQLQTNTVMVAGHVRVGLTCGQMQPDVVTCRAPAVRGAEKVTSAIFVLVANWLTKGVSIRVEQIRLQADRGAVI